MPDSKSVHDCPECDRQFGSEKAVQIHYRKQHDAPFPWGDRTIYGRNWDKIRKEAIDRDGGECQGCGKVDVESFHVHHIDGNKRNSDLENLETLCPSCHYDIHNLRKGEDFRLLPRDKPILDMLQEGRCTAAYIAHERDYSHGNVRNRLNRLVEHGHVEKLYQGLYQLVDDPREK